MDVSLRSRLFIRRDAVVVEEVLHHVVVDEGGGGVGPFDGARAIHFGQDDEFWVVDWGESDDGGDGCARAAEGFAVFIGLSGSGFGS